MNWFSFLSADLTSSHRKHTISFTAYKDKWGVITTRKVAYFLFHKAYLLVGSLQTPMRNGSFIHSLGSFHFRSTRRLLNKSTRCVVISKSFFERRDRVGRSSRKGICLSLKLIYHIWKLRSLSNSAIYRHFALSEYTHSLHLKKFLAN